MNAEKKWQKKLRCSHLSKPTCTITVLINHPHRFSETPQTKIGMRSSTNRRTRLPNSHHFYNTLHRIHGMECHHWLTTTEVQICN